MKWVNESGANWFPVSDESIIYDEIRPGIYQLFKVTSAAGSRIGLYRLGDKFEFPYKIYDLGTSELQKKIIKTWNSDLYKTKGRNLGVIYNGVKGTGKTVAAKILCNALNMPTILVQNYSDGFGEFIQGLNFECSILIDEAEKSFGYDEEDASRDLLRMIDGVLSNSRKLFILTTNHTDMMDNNFFDRPSRIRYIRDFSGIPDSTVKEYIADNLISKDKVEELLEYLKGSSITSIDILKSLIEEINIHETVDLSNFNLRPKQRIYSVYVFHPKCSDDMVKRMAKFINKNSDPSWIESSNSLKHVNLLCESFPEFNGLDFSPYDSICDFLGSHEVFERYYKGAYGFWGNKVEVGDEVDHHEVLAVCGDLVRTDDSTYTGPAEFNCFVKVI